MNIFTKPKLHKDLVLLILTGCFYLFTPLTGNAQQNIPLTYKYGVDGEYVCPKDPLGPNDKLILSVSNLDKDKIKEFLTKTKVQFKASDQGYQQAVDLQTALSKGTAAGVAALADCQKNGTLGDNFDLNSYLGLKGFEKFKISPFLNFGANDLSCEITISKKSAEDPQKAPAADGADLGKKYVYIPTPDTEKGWSGPYPDKPLLNGHTIYELEYDFGRYDPVKIWKRIGDKLPNSEYYSATDKNIARPHARRDLLLSIRNFHPYRDSLSVSVDFLDRNLEHAQDFTSAYSQGVNNSPTGSTPAKAGGAGGVNGETPEKNGAPSLTDQFKELSAELDFYYKDKCRKRVIDIKVLDNGISYIKSRMTELLHITDFSEAGIIKQAEDLAQKNNYTVDADFTAAVRSAASNFMKVSRYNYFDNRDIFIQNRDAVQITLNFFRDGKAIPNLTETRPYNISNGFKVDFSLGLYGSFLKDNLYTTKPAADTTFFTASNGKVNRDSIVSISPNGKAKIIRDNQGGFNMGPAVFSHVYWKTGSEVNAGLTFGISIDQTATPRYLLGGSLMVGLDSRWTITYGAAFGKVKALASGLTEGQVVDLSNYPNSTLPTKDFMEVRGFVGVSWNFTGFNIGGSKTAANH